MDFKFDEDFSSARRIKKRIADLELAIVYTKKTVRIRQNHKTLERLNKDLKRHIYQYNKFELFDHIESQLTPLLEQQIKDMFD